jgi:hypothetical protein
MKSLSSDDVFLDLWRAFTDFKPNDVPKAPSQATSFREAVVAVKYQAVVDYFLAYLCPE